MHQNSGLKHMFYVCLVFSSHSRIFHLYGDVTITGEGLQILTYARHSWPLSSEGSLGATPTVTRGIRLIKVTLTLYAERLAVELSLSVYNLGPSRMGFEYPTFRLRGERSSPLRHRRGMLGIYRVLKIHLIVRTYPFLFSYATFYDLE